MGYELRRWLMDQLSRDVSQGERMVAGEIADQANDETRRAYGHELLAIVERRTGMSQRAISDALRRLALRGWELRVQVGKDAKSGRPIYAWAGHQTEYRIPEEWSRPRGAFPTAKNEETPATRDHLPPATRGHSEKDPGITGPETPGLRDQRPRENVEETPATRGPSPQSPHSSPHSSPQGSASLRSAGAPPRAADPEQKITEEQTPLEFRPEPVVIDEKPEPITLRNYRKATAGERAAMAVQRAQEHARTAPHDRPAPKMTRCCGKDDGHPVHERGNRMFDHNHQGTDPDRCSFNCPPKELAA